MPETRTTVPTESELHRELVVQTNSEGLGVAFRITDIGDTHVQVDALLGNAIAVHVVDRTEKLEKLLGLSSSMTPETAPKLVPYHSLSTGALKQRGIDLGLAPDRIITMVGGKVYDETLVIDENGEPGEDELVEVSVTDEQRAALQKILYQY